MNLQTIFQYLAASLGFTFIIYILGKGIIVFFDTMEKMQEMPKQIQRAIRFIAIESDMRALLAIKKLKIGLEKLVSGKIKTSGNRLGQRVSKVKEQVFNVEEQVSDLEKRLPAKIDSSNQEMKDFFLAELDKRLPKQ